MNLHLSALTVRGLAVKDANPMPESKIPFVHNFFTRSAPGMSAHKGG
jgi:hypothetical protein